MILDAAGRTLLLLDPWAARVWRSCAGRTAEAIRSAAGGPPDRVHETLQALAHAGLVLPVGDTWIRSPVDWVP